VVEPDGAMTETSAGAMLVASTAAHPRSSTATSTPRLRTRGTRQRQPEVGGAGRLILEEESLPHPKALASEDRSSSI
jgi:hypothetical protein